MRFLRRLAVAIVLAGLAGCRRPDAAGQGGPHPAGAGGATGSSASVASTAAPIVATVAPAADAAPEGPRRYTLVARLTAPRGAFNDRFGAESAVDGETLFVGAPYRDEPSLDAGVVYVFRRDASGYSLAQTLRSPRPTAHFGERLAVIGGRLLVSRTFARVDEPPRWFERRGTELVYAGALAWPEGERIEHFGNAFAVHGARLLVAARGTYVVPGRAFLFRDEGGTLAREHRFDPEGAPDFEEYNYYLGERIAFDDRHAVFVAQLDPPSKSAIVIFRRGEDGWKRVETLSAPTAEVALSGSRLLVAAPDPSGPVSVYQDDGTRWGLAQKIGAGAGVAAEGDLAVLSSGAVFRWDGARFVEVQRLTRSGGRPFSGAGSVLLRGGMLVLGEPEEDGKGAVHVFEAER